MENFGIKLEDVLLEYDKYFMSKLINKDYEFNDLRNKLREFSKTSDLFEYNDNLTEQEVVANIRKKQEELLKHDIEE